MGKSNLLEALDLLLDELRATIALVNQSGAAAQMAGRLAEAEQALARAKGLQAIRREMEAIRGRLNGLVGDIERPTKAADEVTAHSTNEVFVSDSWSRRGQTTSNDEYRIPILRALVALGGSAPSHAVLERVFREMKDRLLPLDFEHQPNRSDCLRWEYRANWCRLGLRQDGLVRGGSPRGLWEITEAGRRWLEEQEKAK